MKRKKPPIPKADHPWRTTLFPKRRKGRVHVAKAAPSVPKLSPRPREARFD